jgi:hypothetical protein
MDYTGSEPTLTPLFTIQSGNASLENGRIVFLSAGEVVVEGFCAGDSNYLDSTRISKTIQVQATPINPFLGLNKLYTQNSTNGPTVGVVQGTNTYTYEGIQYAEASALARIRNIDVMSPGSNSFTFAYLGRTNEVAPGLVGYSGNSNPPVFSTYEEATNRYVDGTYLFQGRDIGYNIVTNAPVVWSNSVTAFPDQAPAIQGQWVAGSLRLANPSVTNTISWGAWTNTSTNSLIRVEIKPSGDISYSPSAQTTLTSVLPADSTNCAVTGLTSNSYYQARISFIGYQSGTVHSSSTQFRIVTGPQNPPSNPQILGSSPLGVLYVASGGDVVGTLASISDEDSGDVVSVELPLYIAGVSNDNWMFFLEGNQLKLRTSEFYSGFGANNQSSYSIVLRARDSFGLYTDTAYSIFVRADVSGQITFVDPADLTYSGQPKAPSAQAAGVTGFSFKYVSQDGTSYRESSAPPTNAGQYTVTATVTDVDKVGSASKNFEIAKGVQFAVSGSLGSATISFGGTTTVTASGGSGIGAYEFRQNGGTGSVSFTGTGDTTRTINTTTAGTAVIEVRRVADANYNDSAWVSAGTLTVYDPDLPVPGPDAFAAKLAAGMTTKVTLASLLTNDRPSANLADARTVTLESASLTSTGGASIRVKGGWVIYQPSPSAQNGTTDTFTYTVSNGGTKTATGTVTVSLVAPNYVVRVEIDRVSGDKVYFSVMPGMTFEVQGTSELGTSPDWTVLPNGSNPYWTSGADGRLIVTDPEAADSRYYKFRWIP